MKKITCLIIDDEPLALDLLESYVRRTPFLELAGRCSNAFEAMEQLAQQPVDLLFLDIQMPDLSGVEFSRTLKNGPKVIFTTAFEQYALEGFKVDALDYLLKPFSYEEFLKAANKAAEWFQLVWQQGQKTADENCLFVKSEYKLIQIKLDEVLYFEGLKDYIKIYLRGHDKPILTLMTLKAVEEKLPPEKFMRVHRSFIIHLEKIESVERSRIIIGDFSVVVAEQYREKFNQYLSSRFLNS
ncbi:MAG TPA: LytTR family DNA-binding domain-containing protein [Saprospiraceae bacterium]|nr:LytTR family DNA-binding domain-containing protein [Saprospiraceae bacterium]HMP25718.1 LytTR family DNA-binding domain-containing protein [Saprospiraceae bacterium]